MKDLQYEVDLGNDNRIAPGAIQVLDFEALIGALGTGTIEVVDYEELIGAKASMTITITAFASLALKTFTVNGVTKTEGTNFNATGSNSTTATNLASALAAINGVTASADDAVVTVTADDFGRDGDLIGVSTNATAGCTLSEAHLIGGKDHATVTVGTDELVQGTDFTAETDEETTAGNLATAIAALTGVTASADGAVVTITADAVGVDGNLALVATWDNEAVTALTLSGSTMTGGVDEAVITFGATELVQGTDFDAEVSNATTATNIAAAIEALDNFSAEVDGSDNTLVIVTADAAGSAGNVAFSSNAESALATTEMSGGADYCYSDSFDYDQEELSAIEVTAKVTDLTGEGAVVNVFVEVSFDKVDWEEVYQFDTFTANGSQTVKLTEIKKFARFKFEVVGGTATVGIKAATSMFGGDADKMTTPISGNYTILDDGEGSPDVPVALSSNSVNFEYIDVQADEGNSGNIEIGEVVLIPGASKRFVADNLNNITITDGTIGDIVHWEGMQK